MLRVMGLYFDSARNLIHSVSKDQKYRVLDIQKQVLVADYEPSEYELTNLLVSEERRKAFLADRSGSIFIFDVTEVRLSSLELSFRLNRNPLSIWRAASGL